MTPLHTLIPIVAASSTVQLRNVLYYRYQPCTTCSLRLRRPTRTPDIIHQKDIHGISRNARFQNAQRKKRHSERNQVLCSSGKEWTCFWGSWSTSSQSQLPPRANLPQVTSLTFHYVVGNRRTWKKGELRHLTHVCRHKCSEENPVKK